MDRQAAMALLDAAADERGRARIKGVGRRFEFRHSHPVGPAYIMFADDDSLSGENDKWRLPDGTRRVDHPRYGDKAYESGTYQGRP